MKVVWQVWAQATQVLTSELYQQVTETAVAPVSLPQPGSMCTRDSPLWPANRGGKGLTGESFDTWSQKRTAAHAALLWRSSVRVLRGSPPSGEDFNWYTWSFTFHGHRSIPRQEYA